MKPEDSREELLADVLAEDGLEVFKASLHRRCLEELDRKRRPRTLPLALAAAAAVLAVTVRLFFWTAGDDSLSGTSHAARVPWLVRTAPLSAQQFVTTSSSNQSVRIVCTERHEYLAVNTPSRRDETTNDSPLPFSEIDDEDLLAMFEDVQRALIKTPDGGRTLKFLDPRDTAKFLAVLK